MGHHHGHNHHSSKDGLSLAFWLNFLFSLIEVIGGILTNSTAIIADAFHDFTDAIAIGIAVLLEKVSGKKRSSKFSYGYRRFSLLSALGMSVFLLTGAVIMVVNAINSLLHPAEVNSLGMLGLAVLGVAINGIAFLRLKNGNGHTHGNSQCSPEDAHGHVHGHSPNQGHDHNSRAIMLHLLEDVLGWIAVLVGATVIYFTGWFWIDGVLALGIAGFIGYNATKNLIATMKVLLQSVPDNVNLAELLTDLNRIDGVESIHDLHVWSMDGNYNIGSLHAVIEQSDKLKEQHIQASIIKLLENYHIQHPTIQIDTDLKNCKLVSC